MDRVRDTAVHVAEVDDAAGGDEEDTLDGGALGGNPLDDTVEEDGGVDEGRVCSATERDDEAFVTVNALHVFVFDVFAFVVGFSMKENREL